MPNNLRHDDSNANPVADAEPEQRECPQALELQMPHEVADCHEYRFAISLQPLRNGQEPGQVPIIQPQLPVNKTLISFAMQ